MELFWHRRDLRVADNVGLAAATGTRDDGRGPAAPVFVFDPDVLDHASDVRVRRLLDGLAALRDDYRDRGGSDLLVARGAPRPSSPNWPPRSTPSASSGTRTTRGSLASATRACGRRSTTPESTARYSTTRCYTPESIRTNAGDPYSVYSYYWKKWTDRVADPPAPTPDAGDLVDAGDLTAAVGTDGGAETDGGAAIDRVAVGDLPAPADLGFAEPEADVGPAGTEAARDRLDDFLSEAVFSYDAERDYPAREATSRMSAFLKYGEIGCERRTRRRKTRWRWRRKRPGSETRAVTMRTTTTGPVAAVEEYQKQLAWREFYTQVLYHNPEVVTENYKEYEEGIAWRDDPDGSRRGSVARRGTQSSTPGCASSVRRRSCTTACG